MRTLLHTLCFVAILSLVGCSGDSSPAGPDGNGGGNGGGGGGGPLPDVTPPSAVTELTLNYSAEDRKATLCWTAPSDDTPDEGVARYDIRYAFTQGFYPPQFWDFATPLSNPPTPADPGSEQTFVFDSPDRARDLYVGIRSFDEADNRSAPSDLAVVHIPGVKVSGMIRDAFTGVPLEGLKVTIAATGVYTITTDASGSFSRDDLNPGSINVKVETGNAPTLYHTISQTTTMFDNSSLEFVAIPYMEPVSPEFAGYSLLAVFKLITMTVPPHEILTKWRQYPVPVYIPPYVSPDGLDYKPIAMAAAQRWMDRSGVELFTFVDQPPASGVVLVYRNRDDIQPLIAFTKRTNDAEGYPVTDEIHVINDYSIENNLYRVLLHEFGHTIRFGHLTTRSFIMYGGQPLPNDISEDEATLTVLHAALPTRIDMSIYDEGIPTR